MIRWTGLAPWVFEIPFPGSLISTFLAYLSTREEVSCFTEREGARGRGSLQRERERERERERGRTKEKQNKPFCGRESANLRENERGGESLH